jgi:hypothetical protein
MKYLILAILIGSGMLATPPASAQSHVSIGIHSGDHSDYYYLPDIDMYYYIPQRQYVYLENGHWIFSLHLPARHHDYDFEHGRRIYVKGSRPYLHHDVHYQQYRSYANGHGNGYYSQGHGITGNRPGNRNGHGKRNYSRH